MGDTERQDDSALGAGRTVRRVALLRFAHAATERPEVLVSERGVTIGRASQQPQADVIVRDPRVSLRHASVEFDGTAWRFTDLGSRNGSFVDGAPVASGASLVIGEGSVLRVGDTIAVFCAVPHASEHPEAPTTAFPGVSARAVAVRQRIHALARSAGHVLILGETGTGKERVAREIGSAGRTFVPQNCAELSRELVRSELFGHVRGAFSGATNTRQGLVDLADGGVLFLDEAGELSFDVQPELLRFLEDGQYRAVGSTELRRSTARVVAATNVDLDEAVREGTFRRDLLARLRASNRPLELPPLRDRREDLPGWALQFLREALGDAVPDAPFSAGSLECLLLYPWPENLRELRGVVRGVVETSPAWPIEPAALPPHIQAHRRALRERSRADAAIVTPAPTREQIESALARAGGRMRVAAAELQIDRTRLYRLCEKLSIDVESYRTGG